MNSINLVTESAQKPGPDANADTAAGGIAYKIPETSSQWAKKCKHCYLQLTINPTKTPSFPIIFCTTRVKFFVSVHVAFTMLYEAVVTEVWAFNSPVLSYQDTFDNGLLEISPVKLTVSLSFIICRGLIFMVGWSE